MNAAPRVSGWIVLLVVVAASGARAAACVAFSRNLSDDRDVYLAIATGVWGGRGFSAPETSSPTAFRPPLYPLLLAPISKPDQQVARGALHLALAAGMVLAVFWLAWLSGLSRGRQVVAALLVALDPLLVYYSTLPMTETLAAAASALLLATGTAACKAWQVRQRTLFCALGAVAFGVCVMTRPTYWAFAACVCVFGVVQERWGARDPERHAPRLLDWVIGCVLAVAMIAPWTVRNWLVMGRPILTTTHGGYTLLLGNNEAYYDEVVRQPFGTVWDGSHGPGQQAWAAGLVDEMRAGGIKGEIESDRWMKARAWQSIREQPGVFLTACLRRFLSFWSVRPHADSASTAGRALSWFSAAYYSVLWIALAAGMWNAVRQGGCAVELCLLLIAAFVLAHLVYWTDARMRAPIMPAVAVLAARVGRGRAASGTPSWNG